MAGNAPRSSGAGKNCGLLRQLMQEATILTKSKVFFEKAIFAVLLSGRHAQIVDGLDLSPR